VIVRQTFQPGFFEAADGMLSRENKDYEAVHATASVYAHIFG